MAKDAITLLEKGSCFCALKWVSILCVCVCVCIIVFFSELLI